METMPASSNISDYVTFYPTYEEWKLKDEGGG